MSAIGSRTVSRACLKARARDRVHDDPADELARLLGVSRADLTVDPDAAGFRAGVARLRAAILNGDPGDDAGDDAA